MIVVPRNAPNEQAEIAQLAAQGKLRLVWNARRHAIQVKIPRPISAPARPDSDQVPA